MICLSVLICSTHTRWKTFGQAIQQQIWDQYEQIAPGFQDSVEILMLTDNKKQMLGQKRNVMVDMAQGRYVVFVDDDDRIEPDYLVSLMDAITRYGTDVITFLVSVSINGAEPKICRYSKEYSGDVNTLYNYLRIPNHICCVKRELAMQVSFPNIARGEDSAYSKLLKPHLQTEHVIERVLYHYDFHTATTEAQEHLNASLRVRHQPPIVNVVMMSNGKTSKLRRMTQSAIDSCIAGANSLPVHVLVVEQQPNVLYRHADTVCQSEEFHYNRFANLGAKLGSAPWIMVANNDLIFQDGWLHHLLAANQPVVSPKTPRDSRQIAITENTSGYVNGTHFSGWCFMIRRSLWQEMGGFDEDFPFWCADDSVVEQLRALKIVPTLVPDAEVEHLRSKTLDTEIVPDDLTWAGIDTFNRKYYPHPLAGDPRFIRWERHQRAAR